MKTTTSARQSPLRSVPISSSSPPHRPSWQPGMTLLELTVVILVLLALVTVLFIGASAWKKGSDRTLCLMSQQSVQKGVRGYMNLYGFSPGQTVTGLKSKVIGLGRFVEVEPSCPRNGTYTFGSDQIPSIGVLYMTCSLATNDKHEPDTYIDW